MKRIVFWITATLLFAAIGHVSTVLYSQLNLRSNVIAKLTGEGPVNTLSLMA